jgi:(4-(4-[2-(gamma-L-glutamylamino)ethyl]phenoxymethyl)furan-2-yl)methanamine synthase
MNNYTIGWDIGGAHLKAVVVNAQGVVTQVILQACPLWQGLDELCNALDVIIAEIPDSASLHAITMTGELVDLFQTRYEGVNRIIEVMVNRLQPHEIVIYAGESGFIAADEVSENNIDLIASANWMASAAYAAGKKGAGLFFDIGSTTTDILLFNNAMVKAIGLTDYQRLCTDELVYSGIIRTPVMAVAAKGMFKGNHVNLMAEYFATMADVYRLTGELDEAHDQTATADNGEKTIAGSARRLSRMIGCDYHSQELHAWRQFAVYLRAKQLEKIKQACFRQLSRDEFNNGVFVGAGVGRFLVKALAGQLNFPYMDFSDLFMTQLQQSTLEVADCAPAAAVACLAHSNFTSS